jgi:hypothetical protein
MSKKDPSPDWFARGTAALGIALSIVGLGLTYYNYRWQTAIYQENIAERILVRLSASRTVNDVESFSLDPKGEVGLEIVNIGLRPLYIKRVHMQIESRIFTFYEHDPAKTNEPMKLLGPSEAANYRMSWDFLEHPFTVGPESDSKEEDVQVQVGTSKKTFSFEHQTMYQVSFTHTFRPSRHGTARPAAPRHDP